MLLFETSKLLSGQFDGSCLICLQVSGGGNASAGKWEAEAEKTPFFLVKQWPLRWRMGVEVWFIKKSVCVCVCVCVCVKDSQEVGRKICLSHTHIHTHKLVVCGGVKMSGWYLSNSTLTEERRECVGEGVWYTKLLRLCAHTHTHIHSCQDSPLMGWFVAGAPGQQTKGFLLRYLMPDTWSSESWRVVSCFQDFNPILKADTDISLVKSYQCF